ncbi:MAG TPA: PAS domain S-box protein, partial [Thermoanaerobaculia bacterium]
MRGRWSKRAWLRAAAIAFLIAAAVVGRVSRSEWQSDDLLTAGMAFAAFADGWIGVLVALAVAPLALPMHSNLPASYRVGEWIEFITVGIAVTLASKVLILRRSDAKMRAVFASISDIILILDGDGTCIEMPPNNSLLSRPPEELIGRSISDIFPSDGADLFLSQIASVFASGKMVIIEYPLQIGERLVWFSASVAPLDESSVIWIARDITERKSIEDALEQRVRERTRELSESVEALHVSEERFRLLAWSTTEAVWDLDMATGEVWRGKGYETSFGYAEGQLEPTVAAWRELIHPDDRDRVQQSYTEAIESGEMSWSGEYRFRRADGSYAHILHNAHIVRDDQKRAVRVLGALIDITERKQLAEELEQTKRVTSLGRIAASIAHEVNNVLMAIQPNAEVIHRRAPAELRHVTENIMQAVRRGKRVTEEILRFTRPAEPNLQCVEVGEFLERWTEEIRPLLGGKVQLDIELAGTNVYALADPLQIGQIFTNLAINARDAMQDRGGTLRITAELANSWGSFNFGVVKTPDRFVHFTVRDEGSGISTAQLPHI